MKKIILIFFLGFMTLHSSQAMKNGSGPVWDFYPAVHYGFILKHRPIIEHLTYQHVYALSVDVERPFLKLNPEKMVFGFSNLMINYRNPYVGKEIAVVPYFKYLFNKSNLDYSTGHSQTGIRLGVGLGYFNKRFDRKENIQNLLVSTHINGVIQIALFYQKERVNFAFNFTHASNGAFKMPNYGVNVAALSASVRLRTHLNAGNYWDADTSAAKGKTGLIVETGFSAKETLPTQGRKFFVNTFSVLGYVHGSHAVAWTISNDVVYNRTLIREQEKDGIQNGPDVTQLGVALGADIDLGKFSCTLQYGYNYYRPYAWEGRLYSKLGLKYNVYDHVYAGIRLKANGGKADFIELTMHYKI